jgi:hypothetical protein
MSVGLDRWLAPAAAETRPRCRPGQCSPLGAIDFDARFVKNRTLSRERSKIRAFACADPCGGDRLFRATLAGAALRAKATPWTRASPGRSPVRIGTGRGYPAPRTRRVQPARPGARPRLDAADRRRPPLARPAPASRAGRVRARPLGRLPPDLPTEDAAAAVMIPVRSGGAQPRPLP